MDNYERRAVIVRVIDGDTVIVDVDNGFWQTIRMSCRLFGINAPELNTEEGKASRLFLFNLLQVGTSVLIKSIQPDKYSGRFDGVIVSGGVDVNALMVERGFAQPYKF